MLFHASLVKMLEIFLMDNLSTSVCVASRSTDRPEQNTDNEIKQ